MKKYIAVLAILLAAALFPISFSGSQTSSASDSLFLTVMEGGTITVSANPVNIKTKNTNIVIEVTYQWTIDNEMCDAATAAKYGVEFSGGTTSTLTISNINGKLNNKTLICNYYIYNKSFGRVCTRILQVVAYKPTAPTISTIQSVTVNRNEVCKIAVNASASDGGLLSYQWYEASAEDTREITPIEGAVTSTFTCDTDKGGTRYYQCKVINTKNGKTEWAFSNIATVTVSTPVPTPGYNVKKASVNPGETAELKATLSLSDSERGKITYQWYESEKNNPDKAKAISSATSEVYTVDGNAHSDITRYYFCKITNDLNGEKYTNMDNVVMIEVTFAGQHVHEYGEGKVTTEPTCTENGTKTRTCECGDKQQETISALGHTYGEWAVKTAATENTEGQEERSCTKCGYIETRVIPITAAQSTIGSSGTESEVQTNGQPTAQNKSELWIVVLVLAGAGGGAIYGLVLVKKKNSYFNNKNE